MYGVQQIYDELRRTIANIDRQIDEVKKLAEQNGNNVYEIEDRNGSLLLTPLLVAKASCLNGIALLKSTELRHRSNNRPKTS